MKPATGNARPGTEVFEVFSGPLAENVLREDAPRGHCAGVCAACIWGTVGSDAAKYRSRRAAFALRFLDRKSRLIRNWYYCQTNRIPFSFSGRSTVGATYELAAFRYKIVKIQDIWIGTEFAKFQKSIWASPPEEQPYQSEEWEKCFL